LDFGFSGSGIGFFVGFGSAFFFGFGSVSLDLDRFFWTWMLGCFWIWMLGFSGLGSGFFVGSGLLVLLGFGLGFSTDLDIIKIHPRPLLCKAFLLGKIRFCEKSKFYCRNPEVFSQETLRKLLIRSAVITIKSSLGGLYMLLLGKMYANFF
jgi:hypothetical protein